MVGIEWTVERIALLTKLWTGKKHSASQIAAELGGITRNSVVGKAHRLGLRGIGGSGIGSRKIAKSRQPRPEERIITVKRPPGPTEIKAAAVMEAPAGAGSDLPTSSTLNDVPFIGNCKWIPGPPVASAACCGATTIDGLSYCDFHARICYLPASTRRRAAAA
jgi:GcrA cell cycle regulator